MIPYAVREVFPAPFVSLWKRATELVARVSDEWGNELRCHELARAVEYNLAMSADYVRLSAIDICDGMRGPVEHSWLVLRAAQRDPRSFAILDVYVPGALPVVQLVDRFTIHRLYREQGVRSDIDLEIIRRLNTEMES